MTEEKKSWLSRLKDGLSRSSNKLSDGLTNLFVKKKLDSVVLEELEELLISADLGPSTAAQITAAFGQSRFGREVTDAEVRESLASQIAEILNPCAVPLQIDGQYKPFVLMMVGVNGAGKTTTIGKLAQQFMQQGHKVVLAAADTFRAAAISQLQVWAERAGCEIVTGEQGSDAAALVFRAYAQAKASGADILLVDTAGRLHNKTGLMQELAKMNRVLGKQDELAPHSTVLVLDATTGQNAHAQVEVFREMTKVSGLIVTKLDGSAKGGVLVALADRFKLPIHAIGVGEGIDDLQPFNADDFARALVGGSVATP